MDCSTVSNYIVDFIDNKLNERTHNEIKKHLSECKACEVEYNQTKEIFLSIENTPQKEPGSELKMNFNQMLEKEKSILEKEEHPGKVKIIRLKNLRILLQVAAAIILLVSGYLAGYNSNIKSVNNEQVANMQNDINDMKQQMRAINLLKDESASQRIKAVNYTEEIQNPGSETIEALINTLKTDPNSNVRLAAVYSLSRFKNNQQVKDAFINTLNMQDDPMVQIVIINLLVEMEEVKAVEELKELLNKEDLHEEVKSQAELGVKILS